VVRRHAALAAGVLLLIDVLRVWLPSIITIFGQAASTPAELLGAFGLAWFLAGFAAPPLARTLGPRRVAGAAAVALAALRAALLLVHGGQPQLYLASVGLLAGIAWLAATAESGERLSPGVPAGIAAAAVQHALLGTVDLTWRATWWAVLLGFAEAAAFAVAALRWPGRSGLEVGGWFVVGPALLVSGMLATSPALVSTALSYVPSAVARTVPVYLFIPVTVLAALLFLGQAARPTEKLRYIAPPVLVGATVIFAFAGGRWLLAAILLAAPALGTCVGLAGRRPQQQGYALAGGMVVFGLAAIAYYAAYDIGYPNQWVPIVVAAVIAVYAVRSPVRLERGVVKARLVLAVGVPLLVLAAVTFRVPMTGFQDGLDGPGLRLVTYNIRMGFGLDGTFDPDAAAGAIAAEQPDVVTLSEVDRAWLLNGGHDDLVVLAQRLSMRWYFAPAADSVWGDAILTRVKPSVVRSVRLPAAGAPTGAQALAVVLSVAGQNWTVIATHLQPPPDGPPDEQARAVVAFARSFGTGPTLVAGDLNIEPDSPTMAVFDAGGLLDGFAPYRPVRTFPADRPMQEIDHVLVLGGLRVSGVHVGTTTASDHAPVAATLLPTG
jgi:endonuclease/exonuclease/phosphatase family metal-dependent hydrolase